MNRGRIGSHYHVACLYKDMLIATQSEGSEDHIESRVISGSGFTSAEDVAIVGHEKQHVLAAMSTEAPRLRRYWYPNPAPFLRFGGCSSQANLSGDLPKILKQKERSSRQKEDCLPTAACSEHHDIGS